MDPTRRQFIAGIAGMAATCRLASGAMVAQSQPAPRTLGWALVGLGNLSRNQLMPALTKTKLSRLTAVVSGRAEKQQSAAGKFKIDPKHIYDYESFDRIKDDADIDVVYIVLPNGMHAEYTIRAARAGKHVFCEKPMANTVADCQRMIDACNAAGRMLAIAYRMHYAPHLIEVRKLCREGAIGRVTSINSVFGFNIHPVGWRLSKKLAGGGPLMDIGIYCLNAARFVTGEEPVEVRATIQTDPKDDRFKEVEAAMDFSLKFPSGVVADCRTWYNAPPGVRLRIVGEKGWIHMEPAFGYWGSLTGVSRDGKFQLLNAPNIDLFAAEMDDFSQCILENKPSRVRGEEGLQDMKIIEALYRAAAEGKAVPV